MKHWIGRWVMGVAIIHILVAVVLFSEVLSSIVQDGVFDTIGEDPMRVASVWFLLFGPVLFILGIVLVSWERKTSLPLPKSAGWALLFLGIFGVALMPVSGFWLIFPPVAGILFATS